MGGATYEGELWHVHRVHAGATLRDPKLLTRKTAFACAFPPWHPPFRIFQPHSPLPPLHHRLLHWLWLWLTLLPPLAEARSVALLNSQGSSGAGQGTRFLLGGTTLHNSSSFLDFVQDAASRCAPSIARPSPSSTSSSAAAGTGAPHPLHLNTNANASTLSGVAGGVGAGAASASATGPGALLDPSRIGEAAEGARDLARGFFGRVQGAVQGL